MKKIIYKIKAIDRKINKNRRRKQLKSDDFTIISDNCWSSFVYNAHDIPYNSPTIGLFILSDDYLKFLANLEYYCTSELSFIETKESKNYEKLKNRKTFGSYPIGKIDDIEIYFMHYENQEEAYDKWTRRCSRINWDKLLIKMNDQNYFKEEYIEDFKKLPYKNKLLFSAKKYNDSSVTYLKSCKNMNTVDTYYEPYKNTKEVKITKILSEL